MEEKTPKEILRDQFRKIAISDKIYNCFSAAANKCIQNGHPEIEASMLTKHIEGAVYIKWGEKMSLKPYAAILTDAYEIEFPQNAGRIKLV